MLLPTAKPPTLCSQAVRDSSFKYLIGANADEL